MKRKKEIFIEILRMFACVLVVLYHSRYEVYTYISGGGKINSLDNACLNGCFVLGRFAVPLFFIISGYFSFPMKGNTFSFLKNRLKRIFYPLMIWLIIYTICLSKFDRMGYDIFHLVQAPHLWFLYALFGITLMIPLISNFICNANKNELLFYIFIWMITLVFNGNYFNYFLNIETDHNGMLFTNPISALINFYGYLGYVIIGHYFKKYEIRTFVSLALLAAGCFLTLFLYSFVHLPMDRIIAYCSISNLFISSAIFLLVRQFFKKLSVKEPLYNFVCKIGSLSFGIYLSHWLVFQLVYRILGIHSVNCIVVSALIFLLSAIVTYMISLTPLKKYIIG